MQKPVDILRIFYCYSDQDEAFRDGLDRHLAILKRLRKITACYDRKINKAGIAWKSEIEQHLQSANIILLLISADFINSDYCYGTEMRKALELHHAGLTHVIPILTRPVDWSGAPFADLQMLPPKGKPISSWHNRDKAFCEVAQGIREIVDKLLLKEQMVKDSQQYIVSLLDSV